MPCEQKVKYQQIIQKMGTNIERIEYIINLLDSDVLTEEILLSLSNELKELMGEDEKSSQ